MARVRNTGRDVPPGLVRERGYAIALGHGAGAHLETVTTRLHDGDPQVSQETLREAMVSVVGGYNPTSYDAGSVELRSLSAPVFTAAGQVAFTLTLWGPPGFSSGEVVRRHVAELLAATSAATAAIGGRVPTG